MAEAPRTEKETRNLGVSLVESLLTALVRLEGDALVMHVGEKPYVVTTSESANAFRGPLSWGQVELSTRTLTVDAVAGMVGQLLPEDQRAILADVGAVEYDLPDNAQIAGRFTVIAARGGDDIWLEIRHLRPQPVAPVVEVAEPQAPEVRAAEPETAPAQAAGAAAPQAGQVPEAEQPVLAAGEPVEVAAPVEAAEGPVEVAAPVQAAEEPVEVAAPVQAAEEPVEVAEPVEAAEEPVEVAEPVEAAEEPVEVAGPVEAAEEPVEVAEPVQAAEEPVEVAEPVLAAAPIQVEEPVRAEEPEAADLPLVHDVPKAAAPVPREAPSDIEIEIDLKPVGPVAVFTPAPAPPLPAPAAQGSDEEEDVYDISLDGFQDEALEIVVTPITEQARPELAAEETPAEQAQAEPVPEPVAVEHAPAEHAKATILVPEPLSSVEPPRPAVVLPLARPSVRGERADDGAAIQRTSLDRLLRVAAARGASALYIVTDTRPAVRVDGEIQILDGEEALGSADVATMLMELAPEPSRQALQKGAVTEWICDVAEVGRVRCMSFHDHRGQGGIFRMLPARALSVEQLGLSREIQALCREAEGLVLVTGPRSSGKSTLVSAFVDLINRTRADHVITLEGQIKFVHESRRSLVSQRELRGDAEELKAAVRAALREDPDVLVIEDLRSADLIAAGIAAAESGRLVFGALPAPSTVAALERLLDQFPEDRRAAVQTSLASTLRGVVTQVLLRKVGGGRVAAREVLLSTPSVAALIAEGHTRQLVPALDAGRKVGMAPLNDALVSFVRSGAVAPAEAYRKSADREGLLVQLRREGMDTSFVERLA